MTIVGLLITTALAAEAQRPPHIGGYTPNSQMLMWCKSEELDEYASCRSFIAGVIESSGMPASQWPKGLIELPLDVMTWDMVPAVIAHIEGLPLEKMSEPAAVSIYEAVVARHPYRPRHPERREGSE